MLDRTTLVLLGVLALMVAATADSAIAMAETTTASTETTESWVSPNVSYDWVNFRVHPIGLLSGNYGGDFLVHILPILRLGAGASWLRPAEGTGPVDFMQIGVIGQYFPLGEMKGWVLSPSIYYVRMSVHETPSSDTIGGSLHNYALGVNGGYEWHIGPHLNFMAGVGAVYVFADKNRITYLNDRGLRRAASNLQTGVQPTIEIAVGYGI